MRTSFSFDTEDYVCPESYELDDLLKVLCDTMTDNDIVGTFFMIGEKMRVLRERGREDVIDALRKHDVGSHTNMGSIHPTVTERCSAADWANGVARMVADEVVGLLEIGEIVGKPAKHFARHGGSYSPQLINALGKHGVPYVNSPAQLPKHNINWFCNNLNFYSCLALFQNTYHTRETFLEAEQKFYKVVEEYEGFDWVGMFHSHPLAIKMDGFGCQNYYKGIFTPPEEWIVPGFRDDFNLEGLKENFAFHCQRINADPNLQFTPFGDMAVEFGNQAQNASRAEIAALAQMAADAAAPFFTDRFTAAEILDFLARAYLHRWQYGELPESLDRRDVLGPSQNPISVPTARHLNDQAVRRIALGVDTTISLTGMLPTQFRCGEGTIGSMGEVGVSSALPLLGEALLHEDPKATLKPKPFPIYPPEAEAVADEVYPMRKWNPHRQDLDMADIMRHTRLQCWSLKPAWPDAPPAFNG